MANSKKNNSTAKKKQDTCIYELYDKKKKVYIGTTNDLERRENEHKESGKNFTSIKKVSRKMTPESAKKKETEKIGTYRKNHNGKTPKYNKDNDG